MADNFTDEFASFLDDGDDYSKFQRNYKKIFGNLDQVDQAYDLVKSANLSPEEAEKQLRRMKEVKNMKLGDMVQKLHKGPLEDIPIKNVSKEKAKSLSEKALRNIAKVKRHPDLRDIKGPSIDDMVKIKDNQILKKGGKLLGPALRGAGALMGVAFPNSIDVDPYEQELLDRAKKVGRSPAEMPEPREIRENFKYIDEKTGDNPFIKQLAENKKRRIIEAMHKDHNADLERGLEPYQDILKPKMPEPRELSPAQLEAREEQAERDKELAKKLHYQEMRKRDAR